LLTTVAGRVRAGRYSYSAPRGPWEECRAVAHTRPTSRTDTSARPVLPVWGSAATGRNHGRHRTAARLLSNNSRRPSAWL